jgi:enamine deaminase RidA (YjgF/YER057c/UK114 family)
VTERRRVDAISPFAQAMGYCRAIRVGDTIHVSGTAPIMADGGDPPTDGYGQTRRCLEIIVAALEELGAGAGAVVRTRVFITDPEDVDGIVRAHGEVFGEARPASAMVVIAGLLDPRWRVEIEADAVV